MASLATNLDINRLQNHGLADAGVGVIPEQSADCPAVGWPAVLDGISAGRIEACDGPQAGDSVYGGNPLHVNGNPNAPLISAKEKRA
ncbi:MAG TPA: hypothetical protein VI756_14970 [Blastocatellia bacterium]